VPSGAVKWFTRKSGPIPVDADSKRRLIRAALRRRRVARREHAGHAASTHAAGRPRFRCADCGYGIVADGILPRCPMCQASDWVPDVSPHITGASPLNEKSP
jgi:rubrerythrin